MILSSEARIAAAVESGAWGRSTVDDLFRRAAAADAERTAFSDKGSPNVPGLGARYTYGEADRRIEGLAAFLSSVGLKPDMVIGIHLPPCADAAIVILAALRAGLVVCPLPLHWTSREMETAIAVAGIKAIVTASEVEGDATGERVRDVAAAVFAIRFVFAVGVGVPDGLMDLAEVLSIADQIGPAPTVNRRGAAADHVAMVGFCRNGTGQLAAAPFSHSQLVAMAMAHVREAGLAEGATVLSTLHPAGLGGLAAGLLSALALQGTAAFHYTLGARSIAAAAEAGQIVLPAALGPILSPHLPADVGFTLVEVGIESGRAAMIPGGRTVVDLTTFGGLTLLPRRRDGGERGPLPFGQLRLSGPADAPVLAELKIKGRGTRDRRASEGELLISGPLVPDTPWPEPISGNAGGVIAFTSDGALRTGLSARPATNGTSVEVFGAVTDSILVAGEIHPVADLDAAVRAHPDVADAAVYPLKDDLLGSRLGVAVVGQPGKRLTLEALHAWLEEAGLSPVVMPTTLLSVPEIPRAADGTVVRKALFMAAVA